MCRFIESIRIQDGIPMNLYYHNQRFNRTRKDFFNLPEADLSELLPPVPPEYSSGRIKLRVVYDRDIQSIEYQPYLLRIIKTIRLVPVAPDHPVDYRYKTENRSGIDYYRQFLGGADDLILICDGNLTDSLTANIVFSTPEGRWTPEHPLLPGTRRQQEIDRGILKTALITPGDLIRFNRIELINAMLDPGEMILPVSAIVNLSDFI